MRQKIQDLLVITLKECNVILFVSSFKKCFPGMFPLLYLQPCRGVAIEKLWGGETSNNFVSNPNAQNYLQENK
jgi:hypothetical protein